MMIRICIVLDVHVIFRAAVEVIYTYTAMISSNGCTQSVIHGPHISYYYKTFCFYFWVCDDATQQSRFACTYPLARDTKADNNDCRPWTYNAKPRQDNESVDKNSKKELEGGFPLKYKIL